MMIVVAIFGVSIHLIYHFFLFYYITLLFRFAGFLTTYTFSLLTTTRVSSAQNTLSTLICQYTGWPCLIGTETGVESSQISNK